MSQPQQGAPSFPFKLGIVATAAKFKVWWEVEAEKAEADEDEDTKPVSFLASRSDSGKGATCFHCGPSASHKTTVCQKLEDISAKDIRKECFRAKWCQKCLDAIWSSQHEC